jgi:LL-H family phage holin
MAFWQSLKLTFSKVFELLLPFIKRMASDAGIFALEMAVIYVPQVANSLKDKDGAEKRKEVFRLIQEAAKAKGIVLADSIINAAIEAAVAKLKQVQGV